LTFVDIDLEDKFLILTIDVSQHDMDAVGLAECLARAASQLWINSQH
jgi:hypothetical protein